MIPKIISGILAAILIAIALYFSTPSVWFWIGFEVLAALLVAVGCSGEWYLHHHPSGRKKKEKDEHHKLESRFIAAVVIGVFMEFFALAHAIPSAIQLEKDVSLANDRAGQANKEVAVLSNDTVRLSINLEEAKSNNLVLQGKMLELEAKRQWRTIMPEQQRAFIELTKNAFKFPIRVRMGANASTEVQSFGRKVREMLDAGGFGETNQELAIAEWPPEINLLYNGGLVNGKVPEMPSVIFVNNLATTSNIVDLRDVQPFLHSFTNSHSDSTIKTAITMIDEDSEQKAFVSVENGEPILHLPIPSKGGLRFSAFTYIQTVFNNVGITTEWMTMTNVPSGICEVFIEPKF